jgi:hypothetical protein
MKINVRKAMRGLYITLILGVVAGAAFSCEPELCEDCYTVTYSDGSSDWTCIEYDCSTY